MKLNKIYMIFILLMVLVLCAGAVSASSNDTVISGTDFANQPVSAVNDLTVSADESDNTLKLSENSIDNSVNDVLLIDNGKEVLSASGDGNVLKATESDVVSLSSSNAVMDKSIVGDILLLNDDLQGNGELSKISNDITKSNDTETDSDNNGSEDVASDKIKDYSIDLDIVPNVAGKNTILTVTVPADVTGRVVIIIDGKGYLVTPEKGVARLNAKLTAGKHLISARVIDDPKYLDSKTDKNLNVVKRTDYNIITKVTPGKNGGKTTISVKVPKDATGDVYIYVSGQAFRSTPYKGLVVVELPLKPGKYLAYARLVDDPLYAIQDSNAVSFIVEDSSSPKSGDNNPTGSVNSLKEKTGTLKDYPTGNPVFVLLLVLISMGTLPLRRIKK